MEQTMEKLIDLQKVCRRKQAQIEKKKLQIQNEKQSNLLHRTLKERQITIGCVDKYNLTSTYAQKYKIQMDNERHLLFPVLFIYPQYKQSDFIEKFEENQRFVDHFKNMFASKSVLPKWDAQSEYVWNRLTVYYETKDRFVNVNVHKTLKQIVHRTDYIVPILPVFFVLSKDSDFTRTFLQEKYDQIVN